VDRRQLPVHRAPIRRLTPQQHPHMPARHSARNVAATTAARSITGLAVAAGGSKIKREAYRGGERGATACKSSKQIAPEQHETRAILRARMRKPQATFCIKAAASLAKLTGDPEDGRQHDGEADQRPSSSSHSSAPQ